MVVAVGTPGHAQEPVFLQHRWEIDPDIGGQWVLSQERPTRTIAVDRLRSPDTQHRVSEAQAVILYSRTATITNPQAGLQAIIERLEVGEPNRQVKLAMVSAAVSLAEASDAVTLWKAIGDDSVARRALEPKLVEWDSDVALPIWRKRLIQPRIGQSELLVAIEGIGYAGGSEDCQVLEAMVRDPSTAASIRFAAARALGNLKPQGLESLAEAMATTGPPNGQLVAAQLLRHHTSLAAERLLLDGLKSDSAAAHAVIFAALVENFPSQALERAADMLEHPDNTMRLQAVALLQDQNDVGSLNTQAHALTDRNVHVRRQVRENLLLKAAQPEFRSAIDDIVSYHLTGPSWRGTEQTIVLVVQLNDHSRAPALVALLEHPRDEVNVRAGWALQSLELDEDVLANILKHCQPTTARLANGEPVSFAEESRVAFCFEALGRHAYRPADELLQEYVPKRGQLMRESTRTSAIYALGRIWEGRSHPQLSQELVRRLLDNNPLEAEARTVQYVAAVALGRIGDSESVAGLRKGERYGPIALAIDWALDRLGASRSQPAEAP